MKNRLFYSAFLLCLMLAFSVQAQQNKIKTKTNKAVNLDTGWYLINEKEGSVEVKLSQEETYYHLMPKPLVLWSDVETMRFVNHEKFGYAAILIALKREMIEKLKDENTDSEETQWGLVVNNELVLVQSINKQRFSGNFQISTHDNVEWLKGVYENLKQINTK